MKNEKANIEKSNEINSTDSYSSKNATYSLTPNEKHILYVYGDHNKLFISAYNAVVSYFQEKIKFENLPDGYNSNDIWNKLKNGTMGFIKYLKKVWPVNISVNKFNFLEQGIDITINEALSPTLNGKNYTIDELGEFDNIVEVRLNQKRLPLLLIIKPYLKELGSVWRNICEEDKRFLDFYILNKSIFKTSQKEEKIFNEKVKNNANLVHMIDFTSIVSNVDADYKNAFLEFKFTPKTQFLINKYNFVIMEMFKAVGIIINNMSDKKGANLIEAEISTENTRTMYLFNSFYNQIKYDIEKVNIKLGTSINVVLIEEEKNLENEKGEDNDNNDN